MPGRVGPMKHALTIRRGHYVRNQRLVGTLCSLNAISWGRGGRCRGIHRCLRNGQPRQIGWGRLYSLNSTFTLETFENSENGTLSNLGFVSFELFGH